MEEPAYQIRVLYYQDPYKIWVHRLADDTGEDQFEQIGLYGVLPLVCVIDNEANALIAERSDSWTPASVKLMSEFFREADEVWFESKFADRRFSVFDAGLHKFGKIYIKKSHDSVKKLSSFLTKARLAAKCKVDFHDSYRAGNIRVRLEEGDAFKVMRELMSKVNDDARMLAKLVEAMSNKMVVKSNMEELEKYLMESARDDRDAEFSLETKINLTMSDISKILKSKMSDYNAYLRADDGEQCGRAVHKSNAKTCRLTRALQAVKKGDELKKGGGLARQKGSGVVDEVDCSTTLSEVLCDIGDGRKARQRNSEVDSRKLDRGVGSVRGGDKETGQVMKTTYDALKAKSLEKKELMSRVSDMRTFNLGKQRIEYDEKNDSLFVFCPAGMTSLQNIKVNRKSKLAASVNSERVAVKLAGKATNDRPTNVWENVEDEISAEVSRSLANGKIFEKTVNRRDAGELRVAEKRNVTKSITLTGVRDDRRETTGKEDEAPKKGDQTTKCDNMNRLLRNRCRVSLKSKGKRCPLNGNNTVEADEDDCNSVVSNPVSASSRDTISETNRASDSSESVHLMKRLKGRLARDKQDSKVSIVESNERDDVKLKVNSKRLTFDVTSKFIDKIIARNLMIHSTRFIKTVQPCMKLCDANFPPCVHRGMFGMSVLDPMTIQTVSWPCITRGYNVFLVGPVNSGKTMGYLPAVCSLVYDKEVYADLPDTHGPLCVILTASSRSVSVVAATCQHFLQSHCRVLGAHVGCKESDVQNKLLNGTDVLVTTPPFLYRLLGLDSCVLDLKRLALLVVDDADVVSRKFLKEFMAIYRSVGKMLKKRVNTEMLVQYVAAGREWSDLLKELSQCRTSVVCMSAYEECVVYSLSPVRLEFTLRDDKADAAIRITKKIARKTVIVCCDDDEVRQLEKELSKEFSVVFACGGIKSLEEIYQIDKELSEFDLPYVESVLVCCDEHLKYFSVTDAWCLVHYSLPVSYSAFRRRFSVLIENYRNIYQQEREESKEARVEMLVDETDAEKLPKILRYVERCSGVDVPRPLTELSRRVLAERDAAKIKIGLPICNSLLLFGACQDYWHCSLRHTVDSVHDRPPSWLPRSGWVKFQIIHFHSTAHYSVQILSYDANGVHVDIQQSDSDLALKMSLYFGDDENKRSHGVPMNGDVCAVELKQSYFERCKVIKVRSYRSTGDADEVLVNLMDEEKLEIVKACNLLYLPEALKAEPCRVAQMRILNIIPKDKDECFTAESKDSLRSIVRKYSNLYLKANISLVIGNILFVDSIKCCQDLRNSQLSVVRFHIKEDLLSNDLVIEDKNHYDSLLEFCRKCDYVGVDSLSVDANEEVVTPEKRKDVLVEPQWAHLRPDSYNQVYVTAIENLQQFYVRQLKWQDELDSLTKYIQSYVSNLKAGSKFDFVNGDLVVAKFPDDSLYYRARVDDADGRRVKCFFVDHGDWRYVDLNCVFPITNDIIKILPLQAVECRLLGLKPVCEAWTDMSTNYMCDLCNLGDNSELKELYVWYYMKDDATCTDGFRYAVVVVDTMHDEDIVFNELFPKVNLAQTVPEEFRMFDSLKVRRRGSIAASGCVNKVGKADFDAASLNSSEISVTFDFPSLKRIADERHDGCPKEASAGRLASPKIVELDENSCRDIVKTNGEVERTNFDAASLNSSEFSVTFDLSGLKKIVDEGQDEGVGGIRGGGLSASPKIVELDENSSSDIVKTPPCPSSSSFETLSEVSARNLNGRPAKVELLPKLLWCQDKYVVTIKIELFGVENYHIDIKNRSLAFDTCVSNKCYKFDVVLFGGVQVDACRHEAKGLYVLVKLRKLLPSIWASLVRGQGKQAWISYDHSVYDCSESDSDGAEELRRENEEFLRGVVARKDSEGESDDDFVRVKDDAGHWGNRYHSD